MSYKRWIFVAIILFGIGLMSGVVTPSSIITLTSEDIAALEELSGVLAPFNVLTAILIFAKNTSVLVISLALSPIFCLVPVLALAFNGWLLAFLSTIAVQEKSLGFLLACLLPHGIFEIPAFIMGEAVALSFGTAVILAPFKKGGTELTLTSVKQKLRYLMVALALLLLAAIVETYVTPLFLT